MDLQCCLLYADVFSLFSFSQVDDEELEKRKYEIKNGIEMIYEMKLAIDVKVLTLSFPFIASKHTKSTSLAALKESKGDSNVQSFHLVGRKVCQKTCRQAASFNHVNCIAKNCEPFIGQLEHNQNIIKSQFEII